MFGDEPGEAAALEVGNGLLPVLMAAQLLLIEVGNLLQQRIKLALTLVDGAGVFFPWYLHAGGIGQVLHRPRKLHVLVVHEKAQRVAACAAAKAVVELFFRVDAEGGRFLVVEWAAGRVVFAGFLELHPTVNHFDDIGPVE